MTEPADPVRTEVPDAWRLVLALDAALLVVVLLVVQWVNSEAIPPLIVFMVLLAVGLALLAARPRIGAVVIGVVAVLTTLGNLAHLLPDLSHPESFWSFLTGAAVVIGSLVGLVGLVAVLRRSSGAAAPLVGVLGAVALVAVAAVAVVATSGQPDDVAQEGDQGMFVLDFRFRPEAFTEPAGEIGIFIGNDDLVRHNLTIDELGVDEELPSKAFVRIPFEAEAGTYEYYCDIEGHEDMRGTLTVE